MRLVAEHGIDQGRLSRPSRRIYRGIGLLADNDIDDPRPDDPRPDGTRPDDVWLRRCARAREPPGRSTPWTQAELADRTGLSRTTIGDIESGRRQVTVNHLPLFRRALGVPLGVLIAGADPADLDVLDPRGTTRQPPPPLGNG